MYFRLKHNQCANHVLIDQSTGEAVTYGSIKDQSYGGFSSMARGYVSRKTIEDQCIVYMGGGSRHEYLYIETPCLMSSSYHFRYYFKLQDMFDVIPEVVVTDSGRAYHRPLLVDYSKKTA
jgi:hypothetical protein